MFEFIDFIEGVGKVDPAYKLWQRREILAFEDVISMTYNVGIMKDLA